MKKYLFIVLMTPIFAIGVVVFLINSAQAALPGEANGDGGGCTPDTLKFTPTSRDWSSANINVDIDQWFDEICDIRYVRHCWTTGSSCDPGTTAANTTGCSASGCLVTQTVDGEWTLCARQREVGGVWSSGNCSFANGYKKGDITPPTVPTPTDAGSATNSSNLYFYGTPSDSGSGLNTCYAQVKNQSGTIVMGTTNVGADGDHLWTGGTTGNTYYYHYYCTDNAGNSSAWSAWSNGIYLDQMPPNILFLPPARWWSSANISVTIDAPDPDGYPTQYIRHCWTTGSSCDPGTTYASTCTISGTSCVVSQTSDGSWTLCARARDALNNWSPIYSTGDVYLKDAVDPTTSALTATPSGWTTSNVTITGTVSDTGGSGVAGYYKKCRPGDSYSYSTGSSISFVCSYTGGVNAYAYGKDNAGNTDASPSYKGYYKDNIAPVTSALTPDIVTSPSNFATSCVMFSGSISDDGGSGMTNWQWKSTGDWLWTSNWQPAFPYIKLNCCVETGIDGYTMYARGVDRAGNVDATPSSATAYTDWTDPTCGSWSPTTSPWKVSGTQAFTLSGSTDSISGIDVAGGNCTTGSTNGSTCTVVISDNAGLTTTCTSPQNRVDTAAPTPNPSTGSAVTTCGASTMDVTWTVTASDGQSGLHSTAYSFNNGSSWQSSNTLVETGISLDPGQYTKTIKTRDAVGNTTTAGTITSEQCAPGEAAVTSVDVIVGPSNVNLSWSGTADGFHVYKQGSKRDTANSTVALNASQAGTLITNMECPEDYTIKIVAWNTDPDVTGVDTSCSGIDDTNLSGKKCAVSTTPAQIRDCTRGFFFD